MTINISVPLPQTPYQVHITPDRLEAIATALQPLKLGKKIMVVSNPEVDGFYGDKIRDSLVQGGYDVFTHLIPAGEEHKNLATITGIYDTAFGAKLERNSTLLALGRGA